MLHSKKGRKEGGGGRGEGGGGLATNLRAQLKSIQFFLVFFFFFFFFAACVVVFFYGLWRGGGTLLKLFVSLNRILKGGATGGCFSGLGELHVSMDLIRVFQ